jgi:uncharacterized protein YqeY
MSLLKQIEQDLIKALKSGNREETETLRGLKSDIKYYQIDKKIDEMTDEHIVDVLSSAAKRRRDSIEQFKAGARDDLVEKESRELKTIKRYLPEPLTEQDIEKLVRETIDEVGAISKSDMGKVMKEIMPKARGRADGKSVKKVVLRLLSGE